MSNVYPDIKFTGKEEKSTHLLFLNSPTCPHDDGEKLLSAYRKAAYMDKEEGRQFNIFYSNKVPKNALKELNDIV